MLGLLPSSAQLEQAAPEAPYLARSFSNPNMLAPTMMQQQLLQFLTSEHNAHLLCLPLPAVFLAQRNGLARSYTASPLSTWRTLRAEITQQYSGHTIPAIGSAMVGSHQGAPMPERPDMLALLAAIATWPLAAALANVPVATALLPFTKQGWVAADVLLNKLRPTVPRRTARGRTPWMSSPDAVAGCAVALLAFAQCAGMIGTCPDLPQLDLSSSMQAAQEASAWLRANPTAAAAPGLPPNDIPEAAALVRLLAWLAKPTSPTATASGVLAEALPALEHRVCTRAPMRQLLAEAGGRWEWAPVAAALHRRLPRRMAARFLPELDRVTAAVAGSPLLSEDAASAAADAAMASLVLVF